MLENLIPSPKETKSLLEWRVTLGSHLGGYTITGIELENWSLIPLALEYLVVSICPSTELQDSPKPMCDFQIFKNNQNHNRQNLRGLVYYGRNSSDYTSSSPQLVNCISEKIEQTACLTHTQRLAATRYAH